MQVLVIFAVEQEFAPWRRLRKFRKLKGASDPIYEALIGQAKVHVAVTGMGSENASRVAHATLSNEYAFCISAGFAGALKQNYRAGDIVVARGVVEQEGSGNCDCSSGLMKWAFSRGAKVAENFLTAQKVINSFDEKRELGRFADVVDMESFAVLKAARIAGRPAVAIRVISDPLGEDMPIDFNATADSRGHISMVRVLRQVSRRPNQVPALLRFGHRSRKAATALVRFLDGYLNQFPSVTHGEIPIELPEVAAR